VEAAMTQSFKAARDLLFAYRTEEVAAGHGVSRHLVN
jgi:hypothetical protein